MNNNTTSKQLTFKELIGEYRIEIPIIQRDYAQGREGKEELRKSFLEALHKAITNEKPLELDFVYGSAKDSVFQPLDGQQRLTTLFLLHWYIAIKESKLNEELKKKLTKFTYKTRTSSREFCNDLINKGIDYSNLLETDYYDKEETKPKNNELSKTIIDSSWFFLSWKKDPTIKSMLTMLDAIHEKFKNETDELWERMKNISFHFIELEGFGLSDDLYIKMNARGKALTEFENFKASFEKVISSNNLSEDFIKKIDGIWLDAFWKFTIESFNKKDDVEQDVSKFTKRCDGFMLSFIKKITEYLYYKDNIGRDYQFNDEIINHIYSKEKKLQFLIQSFDLISELGYKEWEDYFEGIFSEEFQKDRIAIYQPSLNPISKIFNNENFSHFENLLFFGWLHYITSKNSIEITSDLKDFLRIIRNYINNFNQKSKTSLDSELRIDYYNDILNTIFSRRTYDSDPFKNLDINLVSFGKEYIQYEIEKYNLFKDDVYRKELIFKFEDHSTLRGLIFNFDFTSYTNDELQNIVDNFYSLYELDYKDIIRLLLCFGDYSVVVGEGNPEKMGEFRFFGGDGKWHRVLASPEGEIKPNFEELFKIFSEKRIENEDWNDFIENKVSENLDNYKNSWLWYCLKYKTILTHPIYTKNRENRVEIFPKQSLGAYHYNPFVYWFRYHSEEDEEVSNHINEPRSCARHSNFSRLHLKNGVELEQIDNNWLVYNLGEGFNHPSFKFDEERKRYILSCENLIDDLIPFIKDLNLNKSTSDN